MVLASVDAQYMDVRVYVEFDLFNLLANKDCELLAPPAILNVVDGTLKPVGGGDKNTWLGLKPYRRRQHWRVNRGFRDDLHFQNFHHGLWSLLSRDAKLAGRTTAMVALELECEASFLSNLYACSTSCLLDLEESDDRCDEDEEPESIIETAEIPSFQVAEGIVIKSCVD